jgi:hypothetical protein
MRKCCKFMAIVVIVCLCADVALAGLPGPFEFQFFTPFLTGLILLPLQMAGCSF